MVNYSHRSEKIVSGRTTPRFKGDSPIWNLKSKILLVDANETFTAQLSSVLGQNPAFDVVGTANDGECAVELFTSRAAGRADHGPVAAEAGRHFRPERGKLASEAAAGSGADGLSDRLRRAGSGKARRAVLYQQAVQFADGRRARDGNRRGRARGQKSPSGRRRRSRRW